jgi:hypothetical protein
MRYPASLTLITLFAFAPGAAGQVGLSLERAAGLGLKSQSSFALSEEEPVFGGAAAHAWQALRGSDYSLFGGARDVPRLGLRAAESYTGMVYSGAGWGSTLEVGYLPDSMTTPRRYALTGQLHTSLSEGRTLSVGLKYRVYDTDAAWRYGISGDVTSGNAYSLAGPRPGGYSPSYQLQMSYQYAAGAFGLAWGRELETYTPFEASGYAPRQFSFTGQHWLTPSWALSYDILPGEVAAPFRLQGLRLGVRYRF